MNRAYFWVAAILLAFSFQSQAQQSQLSVELKAFTEGSNQFGFDYLRMLQLRKPDDNLLLAPAASSLAFGLLQNGANDEANTEIGTTFHRQDLAIRALNLAAAELTTQLAPPRKVDPNWNSTLRLSISIWGSPDLFRPDLSRIAMESYGGAMRTLSKDVAVNSKMMDAFVTNSLGQPFSIAAPHLQHREFALVVASFFNGKWWSEFDEHRTTPQEFKFRDQVKRPVEMMWKRSEFTYLKGEQFQAVLLPYTDRYAMYVFLPDHKDGIDALVATVNTENWSKWMSGFEKDRLGIVELPRFHVNTSRDTTADYIELGIHQPFSDFSSMAKLVTNPEGAKLTRVLEDASIDVTEKRTIVITRGVVGGVPGGIEGGIIGGPPPPPPFHMLVDHPFLFAIVDAPTETILYLGIVTAPPTTDRKVKSYRDPVEPAVPKMPK